ncbi:hypothetical protein KAFR_0H00570 [Kazachstania africana CBS 2517]|uniref:Palmitoyltransferase n=1 Tax=Kazachstania africana (strain ATCC 22294 / BCRC 22015 / CBS 2517 / CECT 1963 / NBRC 1671 / NRRL Y-8276) TaxID=1071382 RepID=H2AYR0_KAZAF|nr:hypothetical protein KAFR_0H00570 [Kazachstania africana CBS 2517]CCF59466.1 hypothetical protein KAFR_0H00570 [Kazachstania africana CBS 2517]
MPSVEEIESVKEDQVGLLHQEDSEVLSVKEGNEGNDDSSLKPVLSRDLEEENKTDVDPVLQQYHSACQAGNIKTVKEMIDSQVIDVANDFNADDRITGLHWASINNRLNVVKYLLSKGADANFKSNNLSATPLHWAARYGYVYIVDCLLNAGKADPTITDDQGFNLLHLAVNSSNIMLVAYVLFFVVSKGTMDVDTRDSKDRTPLLWASYQGDSLTVSMLLKFGANYKLTDETGFTPLHWGVVKGQPHVLKYLIKEGADFFQKTNDGKDCFTIAKEMNTQYSFNDALAHSGYNLDGYPSKKIFKTSFHAKLVTFLIPFVFMGLTLSLFAHLNPLFALLIVVLIGLACNKAIKEFILPSYVTDNHSTYNVTVSKSPFLAGIFFSSLVWLTIVYLTRIFFNVEVFWENILQNFVLVLNLLVVYYTFLHLIKSDPGLIPSNDDHEEIRNVIQELLSIGKFDTRNFCIETWIRKPLRSKFSTFYNSTVSRFDHYCPWVYNDIGLKNHKIFIFFIISVEIGILIFVCLTMKYFDFLEDYFEDKKKFSCGILGDDELCAGLIFDRFSLLVMTWSLIQSLWVGILIMVQFFQISRGVTNYEFNNYVKESKTGHRHSNTQPNNDFFNTTPEELRHEIGDTDEVINGSESVPDSTRTNTHAHSRSVFGFCCRLIGLDQWVSIIKETIGFDSDDRQFAFSKKLNIPTNYGITQNFKDFFLTSDTKAPIYKRILEEPVASKALLNNKEVDYFALYEFPALEHRDNSMV